ncbi:hypothetical protein Tco_1578787 [Tanacetum coccineum]
MGGQTRPRNYQYLGSPQKDFIQRYCSPSMTAKQLEDIHNFKQEGDESLYQAGARYNDLLYKCPTHDINNHQKLNIFYKGLSTMNHQFLDSQGPILGMTPAQALTTIQTMVDHSQKWHDETTSRNIGSSSSNDGLAALVGCQICEGPYLDKDCPLNEEVKQVEEDRYGEFGRTRPFNGVTTLAKEAVTKIDKNEDCKAKDPGSFILPPKEKYPRSFIQLPPNEKDLGRRKILEALSYPAQLEG